MTGLTLSVSIISIVLVCAALVFCILRNSNCAQGRMHFMHRYFLELTIIVVTGINVMEFVIIPNMI